MERVDGVGLTEWVCAERIEGAEPAPTEMVATLVASPRAQSNPALHAAPAEPGGSTPACDMSRFKEAMTQIVDALDYMHTLGVVHQDLKPSNVMVERDGVVRLLDFGLSSKLGRSLLFDRAGAVIGTPAYMSPELWRGLPATPASDLYALGCMMFRLLTGELSFTGNPQADPPRVAQWVRGVPEAIAEICYRLLNVDPSGRPTIAEVRAALGVREGQGIDRTATSSFVGRDDELAALSGALERVSAGASVVVRVSGISGVGKTALLRTFQSQTPDKRDVLFFRGRCYERESVPYKAFDGMIDALAVRFIDYDEDEIAEILPPWFEELSRAFPVLTSLTEPPHGGREPDADLIEKTVNLGLAATLGEAVTATPRGAPSPPRSAQVSGLEGRRRALEALHTLFGNLAARQPLVLEIDDLQWADADSLALLSKMLESPLANVLLVLLYRPREAAESPGVARYLDALDALPSAQSVALQLGPLGRDEAEELARNTLRSLGLSPSMAPAIAAESAGSPFFLEELAHSIAQRGGTEESNIGLDQVLEARVHALPPAERALVEVLAVANNPIPLVVACHAAGLASGGLQALSVLRRRHFAQGAGERAEDRIGIYHDRMRESVLATLPEAQTVKHHLALGRALSARLPADPSGSSLYDAVRHLSAARSELHDPMERLAAARLHLAAGRQARRAAAFALAFSCFEGGLALLSADSWQSAYKLSLSLHTGAAESAYLSAEWDTMEARIADVKAHARTLLDQLVAWEVQIDAHAGRHEYPLAIDAGMEILELLGVKLPHDPSEADVGAAFQEALAALTRIGPAGLEALPDANDPHVLAAMRIQVRLSPAAYFARPRLLPMLACSLVTTSIERGLSTATPNALAIFGIILNTAGMYPVSHQWGQIALRLIQRWEDRSLEAATRHVVHNLVCPWMVPLKTVLDDSRAVFAIGRRTGDLEYASYAAHTYVYLAIYAGRPLEPLLEEALTIGQQMRALGQINAIHVHEPFEQLLKCMTGAKPNSATLDDDGFDEGAMLARWEAEGSRSGIFILRMQMGIVRYLFGDVAEACEQFEVARQYTDAAPSAWLVPVFHQFAALAACAAWDGLDDTRRASLRSHIEASTEVLRKLAAHAPVNFAHRVSLIEGEVARIDGDSDAALAHFTRALALGGEAGWVGDIALAHELAARVHRERGRTDEARRHGDAAEKIYRGWGAHAKAERVLSS